MSGDLARALKVVCPVCAAKPGYRCYAYSQTLRQIVRWLDKPHAARVRAANAKNEREERMARQIAALRGALTKAKARRG